jgi:lysyl-tRNA synthetase class 2
VEAALDAAPLLVTEWPAPTASLARLKPDDPSVAERMELYAGGLELANGFAELTDPAEQRRRFAADLAERNRLGLPSLPLDEAFLAALAEGMPPAAGMALGIDRLVLLLTGAQAIRDVLPFAWDER